MDASISIMAITAYDLKAYQLHPAVSEDDTRFNVEAIVPAGATPQQAKLMLRHLLATRFRLTFHRARTEMAGYALVIARVGLKIRESTPEPLVAQIDGGRQRAESIKDAEGFRNFRVPNSFNVSFANGLTRWVRTAVPMDSDQGANLCGILNSVVGQPVIDDTGLKGKYDITLTFSTGNPMGEPPIGPGDHAGVEAGLTIFDALEQQLGVKLERRRVMVDTFVIDRVAKNPTEN